MEKAGEYIKPSGPQSFYSRQTRDTSTLGLDDKGNMNGSVVTGQKTPGSKWSSVDGSLRRSFSRERDREGDKRQEGTLA